MHGNGIAFAHHSDLQLACQKERKIDFVWVEDDSVEIKKISSSKLFPNWTSKYRKFPSGDKSREEGTQRDVLKSDDGWD
jgi:hypothetical protein